MSWSVFVNYASLHIYDIIVILLTYCVISLIIFLIKTIKMSKKPKDIKTCGILYVNENAKPGEVPFACVVNDDFFEAAFSKSKSYVIFEIRKDGFNENPHLPKY